MLYLILLVIFLIQFLVIFGVLMFVIFMARPEVPFSDKDSTGALVLVPLHVGCRSADGHNIRTAIAREVGDDHPRRRHLRIQCLALPLQAGGV